MLMADNKMKGAKGKNQLYSFKDDHPQIAGGAREELAGFSQGMSATKRNPTPMEI
jgi:acetoacetate decarboxylase